MNTLQLRLRFLFSPRILLLLLLIGGGGFLLISLFGEDQVARFSLDSPYLEHVELMIKDRLATLPSLRVGAPATPPCKRLRPPTSCGIAW